MMGNAANPMADQHFQWPMWFQRLDEWHAWLDFITDPGGNCSKFSIATSRSIIQGKMAPNPFNMKINAKGYLSEHCIFTFGFVGYGSRSKNVAGWIFFFLLNIETVWRGTFLFEVSISQPTTFEHFTEINFNMVILKRNTIFPNLCLPLLCIL